MLAHFRHDWNKIVEGRYEKSDKEFKAGQNIVYPTHGVGRILTIEKFQYDLVEEQLYVIQFFQDKLTIRVPFAKAKLIGLRNITSKPSMTRTLSVLKQKPKIKKTIKNKRPKLLFDPIFISLYFKLTQRLLRVHILFFDTCYFHWFLHCFSSKRLT